MSAAAAQWRGADHHAHALTRDRRGSVSRTPGRRRTGLPAVGLLQRVQHSDQPRIGRVPEPVLDRVDACRGGGLVDDRLEREVGLPLHRRAACCGPHAGLVRRGDLTRRRAHCGRTRRVRHLVVRPDRRAVATPSSARGPGVRRVPSSSRPVGRPASSAPDRDRRSDRSGGSRPGTPTMLLLASRPTCMSASCGNDASPTVMSSGRIHCTRTGLPTACEMITASASAPSGPGFDRP